MSAPPPSDSIPNLSTLSIQDSSSPSPSPQPAAVVADQAASEEEEEEEDEEEEFEDEFDSEDDSDRNDAYGYGYGYRGYGYGYDDEEGFYSDEYDDEQEYMDQLLDEDEFESTSDGGGELGRRDPSFKRFVMDPTVVIPVEWKGKGILKKLVQGLSPETKRVSLGAITPELANGPFRHVLGEVKKHAANVESFQAEVTVETPTNILGTLVSFIGAHPKIREMILDINYGAHPDAAKELSRLARRVGLERLDLSSSSIPTPVLKIFLRHLRTRLSQSSTVLRHLSLRWDADSRVCETAIVALVKLGRKGLEYLDIRDSSFAFETTKELTTLVETVEKHNTNLQALWLLPREEWLETEEDVQRDELNRLLEQNRNFRADTQTKARALLLPFRIIFHSLPNPLPPS